MWFKPIHKLERNKFRLGIFIKITPTLILKQSFNLLIIIFDYRFLLENCIVTTLIARSDVYKYFKNKIIN